MPPVTGSLRTTRKDSINCEDLDQLPLNVSGLNKTANPRVLYTSENLLRWGKQRADAFIKANGLPPMAVVEVPKDEWKFSQVCAYWRNNVCSICVPYCARVASGENDRRNWNWPGTVSDRTPYGVVCHELGHHCDVFASSQKGRYGGDYSFDLRRRSGEKPITSYCPNDFEWYAEIMRLFITNHALLYLIRPKTWELLVERWTPVSDNDWMTAVGPHCPSRIIGVQEKR